MGQDNSYSRIFKGTLIFGGVQIIQILVRIIRGKLVAILLGAKGMGISSLFLSSTQPLISLTGLGLASSGVRNISEVSTIADKERQLSELSLINQCFYCSYALGFTLTLLLSPLLSYWTFGDLSQTLSYIFLSFFVLFELVCSHFQAILQGMGLLKQVASATIYLTLVTFVIAVSFYYFWGIKGIVSAMVFGSMASAIIRFYQVRKLKIPFKWHPFKEMLSKGGLMIKIGLVSLVSIFFSTIVTYLINIFISKFGRVEDVGLFQAANVIILQSVSMVFASMSADYYPRLAKIANNKEETNIAVNRQTEILCYIAIPILGFMIIASPLIIHILLSEEFLAITNFIKWISFGTAIQLLSYPLGHMAWAKGDMKVLLYLEGFYNSTARLVIYILSYYLGGLGGLGYGICITNAFYLLIISVIVAKRYGYERNQNAKFGFVYLIPLFLLAFLSSKESVFLFILSLAIFSVMSFDCLKKLNAKINLLSSKKSKLSKSNNKKNE